MTYCLAWKQNGSVFMIGDSLLSSKVEFPTMSDVSTIGEVYGKYKGYYVEESKSKIMNINNKIICYAGDTACIDALIDEIVQKDSTFSYLEIFQSLSISENMKNDVELLIGINDSGNNRLYYISYNCCVEVNDYKCIGSGKRIPNLTEVLINYTKDFKHDIDSVQMQITKMVVFLQVIIYKNSMLDYGVGGIVCGCVLTNRQVEWNDDILYFMYSDNDKKTFNISVRNNFVCTGTDFIQDNKIFAPLANHYQESYTKKEIRRMLRINNQNNSRYVVFYSKDFNCIYCCDTEGNMLTHIIQRFVRRSVNDRTHMALLLSPNFIEELISKKSNEEFNIPFFNIRTVRRDFITREQIIRSLEIYEEIEDRDVEFDIDLTYLQIKIDSDKIIDFEKDYLNNVDNILFIDFNYLYKSISERIDFYNNISFDISTWSIKETIYRHFNEFIVDDSSLEIVLFASYEDTYTIQEQDVLQLLCDEIPEASQYYYSKDEYSSIVNGNISLFLRNYYTNENYFSIDKIFMIIDNHVMNGMLDFLPNCNCYKESTDIVLIKSHKVETSIVTPIVYHLIDNFIDYMMGISLNDSGMWDSFKDTEYGVVILNEIEEKIKSLS